MAAAAGAVVGDVSAGDGGGAQSGDQGASDSEERNPDHGEEGLMQRKRAKVKEKTKKGGDKATRSRGNESRAKSTSSMKDGGAGASTGNHDAGGSNKISEGDGQGPKEARAENGSTDDTLGGVPSSVPEFVLDNAREVLRRHLLDPPLPQTEQHRETQKLLHNTLYAGIVRGESNSILLTGPRGSGKTTCVRSVLQQLRTDPAVKERGFVHIELNGLVHGDDAAGLKHMASQLMVAVAEDPQEGEDIAGSAAETARALRQALQQGSGTTSQCIVVVVEEFDVYAHHGQQTLLYTLLDHIQLAAVPMVVVGVTCRVDIYSLLEKRVLSRFSQRFVHLFNAWADFDAYLQQFISMMLLPDTHEPAWFRDAWNARVRALRDNTTLQQELREMHAISTSDLRPLQKMAFQAIALTAPQHPYIRAEGVYEEKLRQTRDAKVTLMLDLSALELCLVIAMNNLRYRGTTSFNFEAVYATYKAFAAGFNKHGADFYRKPVALKAFEQLAALELVRPASAHVSAAARSNTSSGHAATDVYAPVHLFVDHQQVEQVVDRSNTLSTRVKMWAKSHGL